MEDRGMVKTIRTIKTEARALKNIMRADFAELSSHEGQISAYTNRLDTASVRMKKLREEMEHLQQENTRLMNQQGEGTKYNDALQAKIARNLNTIERVRYNMSALNRQMEADREQIARLKTGVDSLRKSTEAITTSTKAYSDALQSQHKWYEADRANISGLRARKLALQEQLRAEVSVTSQLRKKASEYSDEKRHLNSLQTELAHYNALIAENTKKYGANSNEVRRAKNRVVELKSDIQKSSSALKLYGENIGQNSRQLANQAAQATKTAKQLKEVSKASRGIQSTKLASVYRAEAQHVRNFDNAIKESTSHTREWMQKSRGAFAGVGVAIGGMVAEGARAVKSAAEIERRYIEVKNLLIVGDDRRVKQLTKVKDATREMNEMQRRGITYSEKYGFAQKEIGEQYEELVKRGYSGKAALGSMNAMMKASRASGDDLADVVKVTSQAVDAFGLRVNNTNKMMQRTNRVANAMAASADITASSFGDVGTAMGYVSGSARTVGWNVEQTSAALGTLANSGLESTRAKLIA